MLLHPCFSFVTLRISLCDPARPQQLGPLGRLGTDFHANGCLTCAVPPASVQFVADLTLTAEQAREVVAGSKNTDVRKRALVNILGKEEKGEKLNYFFAKETA